MINYKIYDIKKIKPDNRLYFFDANVWLLIIDRPLQPQYFEQPYIDFWDSLIASQRKDEKLIAVNSLLISEIFNAFLRIRFNNFKKALIYKGQLSNTEINIYDFKRDYRKTKDCERDVKLFSSEFLAYSDYVQIFNDSAEKIDLFNFINSFSFDADFNDLFYHKFCKINNLPIVTNDGDFAFNNIEIISNNRKLLSLK
ncbi:hypothetical protein [Adhaeribacter aquaticus]|uniref:hypothetical protein n=1 Tax=Adhaeribacter aquaticus TaxID=299567 RepID=UPI0004092169|nr:hypothetical protein [Adhaeribacter aquaticus]